MATMDDDEEVLTATMIRAARALLDMSQSDLAQKVGVTKRTVIRHENDPDVRRGEVQNRIREVLEQHNIEFLFPEGSKGEGVRKRLRVTR